MMYTVVDASDDSYFRVENSAGGDACGVGLSSTHPRVVNIGGTDIPDTGGVVIPANTWITIYFEMNMITDVCTAYYEGDIATSSMDVTSARTEMALRMDESNTASSIYMDEIYGYSNTLDEVLAGGFSGNLSGVGVGPSYVIINEPANGTSTASRSFSIDVDYFIDSTFHSADTYSHVLAQFCSLAYPEDDCEKFTVTSSTVEDVLTNVTNVLKYFLIAIASVALLVGGIGIMNSMLISVSQRVREIGLRKAVGARKEHIIIQFLIESSFITLLGGIVGVIAGITLTFVAARIIIALGYEWQFLVPFSSVVIGCVVSLSIGIAFGLYPALKASRVSPMEALRYE